MTQAQQMKREARAAAATEREREREHELAMTKLLLDRTTTLTATRGDIVVLTVPRELFVYPGTKPEDVTEAQSQMMEAAHSVLRTICDGLIRQGILPGGAAILGEGMTLTDIPPPWEKHPDAIEEPSKIVKPGTRLYLPPGAKI